MREIKLYETAETIKQGYMLYIVQCQWPSKNIGVHARQTCVLYCISKNSFYKHVKKCIKMNWYNVYNDMLRNLEVDQKDRGKELVKFVSFLTNNNDTPSQVVCKFYRIVFIFQTMLRCFLHKGTMTFVVLLSKRTRCTVSCGLSSIK